MDTKLDGYFGYGVCRGQRSMVILNAVYVSNNKEYVKSFDNLATNKMGKDGKRKVARGAGGKRAER